MVNDVSGTRVNAPLRVSSAHRTGARGTPAYASWPEKPGTYPCLIVLHERYGLVPHIEDVTRRFAAAGFVAIAADLFHAFPDQEALHAGTKGAHPTDDEVLASCEDVFALFADITVADPSRFGMIGLCQTGRYPLVWATRHPIQAAVSVYGTAGIQNWERNAEHPDGVDGVLEKMAAHPNARAAHVLGIFGEDDHVISLADVQRFRNAMEANMLSYQITMYPDAPHGWLNDTMPGRYRAEAAQAAWDEMLRFLDTRLLSTNADERVSWTFRSHLHANYDFNGKKRQA